jgi:RNA polymerase sigma-70 factor, ECF subfamily
MPMGDLPSMAVSGRSVQAEALPSGPRRLLDVFRENAPFVWRALRRLGVAEADVDDVCQEVFVTVHRRIGAFEGRSAVRTWVYGICVRLASDYRKRLRRRRETALDTTFEPTAEPLQERLASAREARALLDRILDGIDDDKRAVFVLYEIEELPMVDVAAAVQCPLQTAYSRLHAARREVQAAADRLRAKGASR